MRWLALLTLGFLGCGLFAMPGRPCRKHEDCAGLPRGYCARAEICTRECSDLDPCPDKTSVCSPQGVRTICLPACKTDTDCPTAFVCSSNVCVVAAPLEPLLP